MLVCYTGRTDDYITAALGTITGQNKIFLRFLDGADHTIIDTLRMINVNFIMYTNTGDLYRETIFLSKVYSRRASEKKKQAVLERGYH